MQAPLPPDEESRLASLDQYQILDTPPEPCFDRIVSLAAAICETPIALFTLIDERRQWFKASVGVNLRETDRAVSICAHTVAGDSLLVVEDATKDPRFFDNPLVSHGPQFKFYAGVPVHASNSQPLGTLCVIDHVSKTLSEKEKYLLEGLAREIESQLQIRKISLNYSLLIEERTILTNMIVHDARNVFLVLGWSLEELEEQHGLESSALGQTRDAVRALAGFCESVAKVNEDRSRGLNVSIKPSDLRVWFESIASQAKAALGRANMKLNTGFEIPDRLIETDTILLARMIQNLYVNAIQACSEGATITLLAHMGDENTMILIVEDDGPGVAEADKEHVFEPYFSHRNSPQNGTGLGLAICRLIARTLGGDIDYETRQPSGARFVIRLPVD